MDDFNDSVTGRGCPPLIEARHVGRVIETRTQRTVILDDLTFDIPDGSLFAINGPSGSGKSTLLNLLTGIDRPTSGAIRFAGDELRPGREDELARWRGGHVGIVFQSFQLIPTLTALENVLLALELGSGAGLPRQGWRARAEACLAVVGLADLGHRLPSELSGGQQQRVAIGRALANDPPLLVADEPTGNLDSHSSRDVFETLAALTDRGKTVVYVTHDPDLAARARARIDLLDGRIVAHDGAQAVVDAIGAAAG
ncbi:MAG: ABC transporter ATP-binding protein [Candidatus Limnocylindrales bacterium]